MVIIIEIKEKSKSDEILSDKILQRIYTIDGVEDVKLIAKFDVVEGEGDGKVNQ